METKIIVDADGRKEITTYDNGIEGEILIEPSAEYLSKEEALRLACPIKTIDPLKGQYALAKTDAERIVILAKKVGWEI